MRPIRVLVDSFVDERLLNAQMGNAREIIRRLGPDIFHVSTLVVGKPDPRIVAGRNTRLSQLLQRRHPVRILSEFLLGTHQLLSKQMGHAAGLHSQKFDWRLITQPWAATFVDFAGEQDLRYAS